MVYFIDFLTDLESCTADSKVFYRRDKVEKVKQLLCTHEYRSYITNETKAALLSKVLGKTIPASEKTADVDEVKKMLKEKAYIVVVSANQIENAVVIRMNIVEPKSKIAML
jgi:predicted transcriptional regulator